MTTEQESVHTDHPARHWDRTCPACNKQEPIGQFAITEQDSSGQPTAWEQTSFGGQPLYTSPQPRTWIGLTENEAHLCFRSANVWHAIEAMLKEKNTTSS